MIFDAVKRDRDAVRRGGLAAFVRLAFPHVEPGTRYVHGRHIEVISALVEEFFRGNRGDTAVHIPPSCMKSLLCTVMGPAHAWIENPRLHVGNASYDQELATRHARMTMELVQSNWFARRWPHVSVPVGSSASDYSTTAGGSRMATSVGGPLTGRHFDALVADDLMKAQKCTPAALDEVTRWWRAARGTRFRVPEKARTLLVSQRLHERDPGYLAQVDGFEILRLPMRFEAKNPCPGDWRTEEGELLYPARFPASAVEKIERGMTPYDVAGQLQQRPFPEGGGMFKEAHLQQLWHTLPARFDKMVIAVDCAFSARQTSDWTVAQLWGRKGKDHYLVAQFRGHVGVKEAANAIVALTKAHAQAAQAAIVVEQAASGEAVIERLKEMGVARVQGVKPLGGKELRAAAALPAFESLEVWLPAVAPWLADLRSEFLAFPNGRNDDMIDAMSHALAYLAKGRSGLVGFAAGLEKCGGAGAVFGGGGGFNMADEYK
jgi:predicted phage terminase large subunit-like protein